MKRNIPVDIIFCGINAFGTNQHFQGYGSPTLISWLYVTSAQAITRTVSFTLYNLSHLGSNASNKQVTDIFVWLQIKSDIWLWSKFCVTWKRINPEDTFGHSRVPSHLLRSGSLMYMCTGSPTLLRAPYLFVDIFRWCEAHPISDITAETTAYGNRPNYCL